MRALKCDRCGNWFENPHFSAYSSLVRVRGKVGSIDLCPSCTDELLAWIDSGKATSTTKED